MRFTYMKFMMPLFDQEGAVGSAASSAPETSASPSVAAGAEPPAAGSAPAADPTGTTAAPATPDVTQQESFAARLKEERAKLEADYTPHKTRSTKLESIAKTAGFESVDDYLSAVEEAESAAAAARQAQQMGVDEDTFKQFFQPVHSELAQTKEQLQQLQRGEVERQVRADYDRLKTTYPDFESLQDKVFDLAEKRVLPLEDAYKLVAYENHVAAAKTAGQAAAVAAIKANADSSTGPAGGDAPDNKFDFTKLSREDRAKYYEKAKRGELTSLH